MNNTRRKELTKLTEKLSALVEEIQIVLDDEQDYFDNIPENLAYSSTAERSEEAISELEDSIEYLTNCIDSIDNAINA